MPISIDKLFSGVVRASDPPYSLQPGEVRRLVNASFREGTITNGLTLEKIEFENQTGTLPNTNTSYSDLLSLGDPQVFAPLDTPDGKFIVGVISERMFRYNLQTCLVEDITPANSFIQCEAMNYLGNDGGTSGAGATAVIYNNNNRPIFVTSDSVRVSDRGINEMPPARFGVSVGNRIANITGNNLLSFSDPLGGRNSPLTFNETFLEANDNISPPTPAGEFFGQVFSIGSSLDNEFVTGMCRLPKYLGPSQEFLAHSLYITTNRHHYIVQANAPRSTWDEIEFIAYAGNQEGFAGPHACTAAGSDIIYINTKGRIRRISESQQTETSLVNTFMDEPLGQYFCENETDFSHRRWYETLDHSRSCIKYSGQRVYATVRPFLTTSINQSGRRYRTISHQALAVGGYVSTIGNQSDLR